ncbi:MAG: type II toxin-antitoxin system VapC family toxin [Thermodesulfobacteriota bacterium]
MIVFFDTAIHIDVLTGRLALEDALQPVGGGPVRLSPVVASELRRGASGRALPRVEELVKRLRPIEPPSWRRCWIEAGRLLPTIFRHHEEVGLHRLQNDALLALTARHTGAVLVTRDRHFETLRRRVPFALQLRDG